MGGRLIVRPSPMSSIPYVELFLGTSYGGLRELFYRGGASIFSVGGFSVEVVKGEGDL